MEEKLNKIITDVEVIKTKVELLEKNFLCKAHSTEINDHEERIRLLEDFKSKTTGALIFGSTLGGILGGSIVGIMGMLLK